MKADMHFHTRLSDGSLKSEEVVLLAKERWINVLVATDHDIVNLEILDLAKRIWIMSCQWAEISTSDPIHWPDDIHLTAYSQWFTELLHNTLSNTRKWRKWKIKSQINNLSNNWFEIGENNFFDYFNKKWLDIDNLNVSHIANFILISEKNKKLLKTIFWFKPTFDQIIKQLLKRSWIYAHIWASEVSPYIPWVEQIWDMLWSDYVYSIAHPNLTFKTPDKLEEFLKRNNNSWINWIEINATAPNEWIKIIVEIWKKFNLMFTFWSDFHNKRDNIHWDLWEMNRFIDNELVRKNIDKLFDYL